MKCAGFFNAHMSTAPNVSRALLVYCLLLFTYHVAMCTERLIKIRQHIQDLHLFFVSCSERLCQLEREPLLLIWGYWWDQGGSQ